MLLTKLLVSQNDVRHSAEHLHRMIGFVEDGGYFTLDAMNEWVSKNGGRVNPPLIGITQFPQGIDLLHDGHNRALAIQLGGRDQMREDEYFTKEYTLDHYTVLEPQNGWFTPFNPLTELRRAEFGDYKFEARCLYDLEPEALAGWIAHHRDGYCFPRDISTVAELVERIRPRLGEPYNAVLDSEIFGVAITADSH